MHADSLGTKWVSVHGGHSGEFCHHATDSLEEILEKYVALGFLWVGISEHVPAPTPEFRYPDQVRAGLTPEFLYERFGRYMTRCRELQRIFAPRLQIFVAMESESYSGYESLMKNLITDFRPDYVVGSVHHVADLGFDYSEDQYMSTAKALGGLDSMYCRYFDLQFEMIETLKPSVVGHFDLIRLFDPDYGSRIQKPDIAWRITRNLEAVANHNLILDFNLRAFYKGANEPYVAAPILQQAAAMGISLVPGDDSHGVSQVGNFMKEGISILENAGVSTNWKMPKCFDF
ncbi:histidinol-phosphatase [Desulfobotulus sp. H1]|uniref:Histidinol-phosphatase n=1 Tax=Desulfobotulus pelophilus TaxID=2823377 RepID=A0ABT3NCM3_9BACT|nr:histidinol-phosphatase [Desulfobotulus pelophilus]MCW7755217.1 histidinol-phosphatase [Desulfobotulus pelophilus]